MEDSISEPLLKRLLKIVIAYQIVALLVLVGWNFITFDKPDWFIMGVPQMILEWSLVGAVAGALFRLSHYPRLSAAEKSELYIWVLAKPFVGVALGAVIYFLAVGGVLVLNGKSEVQHNELLSALGFLAAFSDKFAFSMLSRISIFESSQRKSENKSGNEHDD